MTEMTALEKEEFVVSYAMKHQDSSGAAIARALGLDERYVQKILKKHGLQRNSSGNLVRSQKKAEQKNDFSRDTNGVDEAAIIRELKQIFGSWESSIRRNQQKEEDQQKEKKETASNKRHLLEGYPSRQIDVWGNVQPTANLYTMNVWNYGQRISPRIIRGLKEAYSLPAAYIKLISNADGAVPQWGAFTVEFDKIESKTYHLHYLLPALQDPKKGEETLKEANEKVKMLHEGFTAFASVGKDIYLAFSQEERVYLLEKGEEICVANDIVEFCGMLHKDL